jgi:RNA polymerase sporulation-specific sigma factor
MPKEIIMKYENLVYKIAQKFYGADKEDLVQAGFLGLMKAYKNYKPKYGCKFSTYAYEYIYGEMYEAQNKERLISVRKDSMRLYKNVMHVKDLLTQKYGRDISILETCEYLNIDASDLQDILNSLSAKVSIDATELNLTKKESIDDMILLKESLEELTDLERHVITSRYMSDKSQDETAKTLGISQVKVSRIEKQSKEKMRKFIIA